ncbi:MAG: hypothetical protein K8I30_19875 [Anaerolineae bacterium]|nr:hypothetical protein [Anaerolineae bacterium]
MPDKKNILRRGIQKNVNDPVRSIEEQIAVSLSKRSTFKANLTETELAPILSKVLYTLVMEQKVGGLDVPIVHNVSAMNVHIAGQEASVDCEVHVHSPIKAFIHFQYVLQNHPNEPGRLQLKNGYMGVKETTRPFDLAALAALRVLNVKKVALHELSDPNRLIQRTLPPQLALHGFPGKLCEVQLSFVPEKALAVHLAACKP